MERVYTLKEARAIKDAPVITIEAGNVLVTKDGSRFDEIESGIWRKIRKGTHEPLENVRYVSASHHDGGVIVRPLYVEADGQWTNVSTGKRAVFDELA